MRVTSASKIVLAEFAMSLSGHLSQHVGKGAFIERFMRPWGKTGILLTVIYL